MEVTHSSHPAVQAPGIVQVLEEHNKTLDADLAQDPLLQLYGTWSRNKTQARIKRSHLDILRSEFPALSILKENQFVSDQEIMLATQHKIYNPGNKSRKQGIQKARWQIADLKAEESLSTWFAWTEQRFCFKTLNWFQTIIMFYNQEISCKIIYFQFLLKIKIAGNTRLTSLHGNIGQNRMELLILHSKCDC